MNRYLANLTDKQLNSLRVISDETGVPIAELIRQAIDIWLSEYSDLMVRSISKAGKKLEKPHPDLTTIKR